MRRQFTSFFFTILAGDIVIMILAPIYSGLNDNTLTIEPS
jgi:hypothetical protein